MRNKKKRNILDYIYILYLKEIFMTFETSKITKNNKILFFLIKIITLYVYKFHL